MPDPGAVSRSPQHPAHNTKFVVFTDSDLSLSIEGNNPDRPALSLVTPDIALALKQEYAELAICQLPLFYSQKRPLRVERLEVLADELD